MYVFISLISLGIAVLALQEAQKARDEANDSRAIEIRYARLQPLPELPEFLQKKQAQLPDFINRREGKNHDKSNSFFNHADTFGPNGSYLPPTSRN